MRKNWISLIGCLAVAAGQTVLIAQDDDTAPAAAVEEAPVAESTPVPEAPAAKEVAPAPTFQQAAPERFPSQAPARATTPAQETVQASAVGFRRVSPTGGFANAQRTTVRIVRAGRIVQTRRVGQGGVAQISEVAPGPYTVLASGGEGFAAFGVYLGDASHSVSSRVGLVPSGDARLVRSLIQAHLKSGEAAASDAVAKSMTPSSSDPNSDFEIQADGSVQGQIVRAAADAEDAQPIAGLFVAFVRDGQVASEARSDANGEFTASGLDAGIYSLAVAGPGGFAAFSTEVVQPEAHVQARVKRFQFVALAGGGGSTVIPAAPADAALFNQAAGNNSDSNPAATAMGGGQGAGGLGGGGAGGGAGAGGGFGGGGLLAAAAAAAAGFGLGQLDDDKAVTPKKP